MKQDPSEISQATRAIRNTYAVVNRLPPEVLCAVFEHRDHERDDLVAATHVCQYWRSTLTSNPSLWTYLSVGPGHGVGRTLVYLKRSKSKTIDIVINADLSQELEVFQHLAPHMSRTRSLVVTGCMRVDSPASLLISTPTSSLQSLEISLIQGPMCGPDNRPTFDGIVLFLPKLTKLHLFLPESVGWFRLSSLLRFFSGCPQLEHVFVDLPPTTIHDVVEDQVVLLESLVELDYTCNAVCRVLPYLKLPHLKRLRVWSSFQAGQVNKLADLLPSDGCLLLARATNMGYVSNNDVEGFDLSGKETDISIFGFCTGERFVLTDWFSDESCIPFGQIEHLDFEGLTSSANLSFNPFRNLVTFQFTAGSTQRSNQVLSLLYPEPGAAIPCPSLREIWCNSCWYPRPFVRSLILRLTEREGEGHRLELVHVSCAESLDRGVDVEGYVGNLQVRVEG